MNAYIFQGDIYCARCASYIKEDRVSRRYCEDSDDYPQGPYAQGGGESDTPEHCADCGTFLQNPLTDEGRAWLRAEAKRDGCPPEWLDFYDIEEGSDV